MAVASLAIAILALVLSGLSVIYTRRATQTAESKDRRERTPDLVFGLEQSVGWTDPSVIYFVRNDGPQDLDSVLLYRPETEDGIRYPVARVGDDYADDEIELGPIRLGKTSRFVLAIGPSQSLPDFRVRVVCRSGDDAWTLIRELDYPRIGGVY